MLTRKRCWVLLAAAAWTLYVWGSRIVILWGGDESAAFKAVHTVLAVVSIAFAVAIAWIAWAGWRSLREDSSARPSTPDAPDAPGAGHAPARTHA